MSNLWIGPCQSDRWHVPSATAAAESPWPPLPLHTPAALIFVDSAAFLVLTELLNDLSPSLCLAACLLGCLSAAFLQLRLKLRKRKVKDAQDVQAASARQPTSQSQRSALVAAASPDSSTAKWHLDGHPITLSRPERHPRHPHINWGNKTGQTLHKAWAIKQQSDATKESSKIGIA